LRLQDGNLLICQLEHEIGREPFEVSPRLFVEPPSRDAVKRSEIRIEHGALTAQDTMRLAIASIAIRAVLFFLLMVLAPT
jgi:hypothetical protein